MIWRKDTRIEDHVHSNGVDKQKAVFGTGTKFLITKFLITKFLNNKVPK
jgi:hypothetical protein